MANMLFANNCNTTLSGSITNVATTLSVTSATGFPSPTGSQYFYCTLADAATQTTIEIVKVTAVSGTTFTIVRGQDGTSGTAFASGAVVSLRLVRASLNDFPKLDEDNTFTGTGKFGTTIGVGAATPSASGAGITFPATQSASSDANTLDDYEEGTWTPDIGGVATYGAQDGRYTKIGNFVKLRFLLVVSLKGTGSATTITGMPFTPSGNSPTITGGVVCYAGGLAVSANILGVYCQNNASIAFFSRDSAGTGATTQQVAVIGNGFSAYCEISYMVD